MSSVEELKVRFVVKAKLLGQDKRGREKEYAIQVTLSDESQYTMYRRLKDIALLQAQIISRFPVEAGYFKKSERVIPDCPVKQTIFGVQRAISDDRSFEKLLNSYIKEIPALPASIVKCDLVSNFFSLKASDISVPGSPKSKPKERGKKSNRVIATEDSTISGPLALRSYLTVADYKDKKFNFKEGAVVQVMKKDPGGWWMVENNGSIGWAPASYLVPVDSQDLQTEAVENEKLIVPERVGAKYISISSYQASRDDELSFVRGAVVKMIQKHVDGWWLVRYNGGEGYVPGALFKRFDKRQATIYVKKIQRNFRSRKSTRIVPTIKPKWLGAEDRGTRRHNPEIKKSEEKHTLTLYQAKAIFEGASERFELTLNKNDTVKVLDKNDHGWWYAEDQHGRSGWVPATFLRPVLDSGAGCFVGGEKIVGTEQRIVKGHKAEQEDELSVRRGETVLIINVSTDGWWIVRNTETGKQGLIPSLCLTQAEEGMDDVTEEKNFPEPLDTHPAEPLLDMVDDSSAQSTSGLEKWAEESGSLEDLDEAGEEMDLDYCYVATQNYTKQDMDELDLYEGQVVCVIDDSDNDVWYVNCDGKEGWVPADLLKEYVDDEGPLSGETTSGSATPGSRLNSNPVSSDESEGDLWQTHSNSPGISRRKAMRISTSHKPSNNLTATSPNVHRKIIPDNSYSSSTSSTPSNVVIMVDNKSLEELERESAEAERRVEEAKQLALQLKRKVAYARSAGGEYS